MRKNLVKGMAALAICAAFASCSKDAGFETPNQFELTKNQYNINFVKKYGAVNPNQTWDFTDLTKSFTRGEATVGSLYLYNGFKSSVDNDKKIIEQQTDYTTGISTFNPYFAAEMFAAFSHAKEDVTYNFYHLGIWHNGQVTEVPAQINVKNGYWYDRGGNGALNQNSGRSVDTRSMINDDMYWVAWPTCPNYSQNDRQWNAYVAANLDKFKVENYKVMTVNGRTYWCFDCNKDGDYSDLLFQVVSHEPAAPVWKRYMIEDLGGSDDFDFNDVVVDIYQDYATSSQQAIIRAMGGTKDFSLKINGQVVWTKSVEGVAKGYAVTDMVNTKPIDFNYIVDEFPVSGWNPATNNISITVKDESNGVLTEADIPFPKAGEVPMIIAVYPLLVDWMLERQSIPDNFFYEIEAVTEDE
jgi:hypothetical protein